MGATIKQIEYYLPEKILTNHDIKQEFPEWNDSMIEKKVGIKKRHIVNPNETALDLGFKACLKLFNTINKNEIDFLLFCTQSPDYFLPTGACILQEKLGLSNNIGALDFNLGCSGFVYGLATAKGLISSGIAKNVLLVTAETYSKFIKISDKSNKSIFGDAGAATLISYSEIDKIGAFNLGTDGKGADNLIVKNGASRNKTSMQDEDDNNYLHMNGPEIFNFTIKQIPQSINKTLSLNNLSEANIDYYIFHQANKFMLDYLRKKLKIEEEYFYNNMSETGNTVSCTIPIALYNCIQQQKVKSNDRILVSGFGVGYSWASTIITL